MGMNDSPTRANSSAAYGQSLPMGYGVGPEGASRLRISELGTPNKYAIPT